MRVLIAGGGTGGHVIPALAIARELKARYSAEVLFVGTDRGMENRLVPPAGFGLMKIGDPSRPVTPQTLFHMASITKPFVATAIMQLVEHGKLDLDDPVIKFVPYFACRTCVTRTSPFGKW